MYNLKYNFVYNKASSLEDMLLFIYKLPDNNNTTVLLFISFYFAEISCCILYTDYFVSLLKQVGH